MRPLKGNSRLIRGEYRAEEIHTYFVTHSHGALHSLLGTLPLSLTVAKWSLKSEIQDYIPKKEKAHRLTSLIYQLEIGQMKKRQPLLIELTESIAVKQERGKKKKWLTRIQNTRATLSIKRKKRSTQEELIKEFALSIRISLLRWFSLPDSGLDRDLVHGPILN